MGKWGEISVNGLLGGSFQERVAKSRPIRRRAVKLARDAKLVRVAHAVTEFTLLATPRSKVDVDVADLWIKHLIDGLCTHYNPPRGAKGHDPSHLEGELVTAGVLPGDSANYWGYKGVWAAEPSSFNGVRLTIIANHGKPPHWTPWEFGC